MTYTDKRLEEFDEVFADYFVIKTGLMSDHKGSIKSFISTSIQQALAEERKRMRGEIDGLKEVYMKKDDPEREGEEKDEVDSCCNETLNDLLSSLDKLKEI